MSVSMAASPAHLLHTDEFKDTLNSGCLALATAVCPFLSVGSIVRGAEWDVLPDFSEEER